MVIVSIALLAATLWISLRELRWRGRALLGMTLLLTGVTFWFEPVQQALHLGQIEIVLMAAVTWDRCQPATRRWKGVATGIAAGIKLVPLLFIVYLLLTRRPRAAAVSAGAFAVTVLAGFAVLPGPSARWWLDGYFLDASKTGFVGASVNQSLRGVITRFAGSVAGGTALWLVAALVVAATGLWAAVRLHRSGQEFAGLMTCALTALLVCPISWDHHWVWMAPGLALVVDTARRSVSPANQPRPTSRRFWILVTACLVGVFAAWPRSHGGQWVWLPGGLLNMVPGSYFPYGDKPGYVEYHWYGSELILGNSYVIAGLCLLGLAVVVGLWADGRPAWLPVPSRHGELRAGRTIGRHTE
jgi:alpha-1,2-mannosyltransferase